MLDYLYLLWPNSVSRERSLIFSRSGHDSSVCECADQTILKMPKREIFDGGFFA
jgi:hypothetical protein